MKILEVSSENLGDIQWKSGVSNEFGGVSIENLGVCDENPGSRYKAGGLQW